MYFGYQFNEKYLINSELQEKISNFCKFNKIKVLDLTPYLKASKTDNYYFYDDHFNKFGNKLAADQIFTFLNK